MSSFFPFKEGRLEINVLSLQKISCTRQFVSKLTLRSFALSLRTRTYLHMIFEKEIVEYEALRQKYQKLFVDKMDREEYIKYNEILFSTHSCAIEGNSFSIDDTRDLKEKGLGMIPSGKSLLEAFEMLDHFDAYEYMIKNVDHQLDETFLKEINMRVTLHTITYRAPDAIPGEYTTTDMAAGDTVFGDHEELIAKVPRLLESTEKAIAAGNVHPVVLSARFHGFYEYLHPFRDGNGRTGRLVSNYILLRMGHPQIVIPSDSRQEYISSLRYIRTEATDEHLIKFFFKMANKRMKEELQQKEANTKRFPTFLF